MSLKNCKKQLLSGNTMKILPDDVRMEKQWHPGISPEMPFDLTWQAGGPQPELRGDLHGALQLTLVLAGEAEVVLPECRADCGPGDVWWTMSWEPHAYRLQGKHNFALSVNLDAGRLGSCAPFNKVDFLLAFSAPGPLRYRPGNDVERAAIRAMGKRFYRLYIQRPPHWEYRIWLELHQFLLTAVEFIHAHGMHTPPAAGDYGRILPAVTAVRREEGRPPSLAAAARLCSLSPSRFAAVFRRCMGTGYGQFALRVRLAAAARDISANTLTLAEIAQKWGFCDDSSFSNAFRKVYRCPPGHFRRRED